MVNFAISVKQADLRWQIKLYKTERQQERQKVNVLWLWRNDNNNIYFIDTNI